MKKVFNQKEILIMDGGLGSPVLSRAHAPIGYAPEKLNLTQPEVVLSVHRDYVEAGSDLVLTNTFGVNILRYDADTCAEMVKSAYNLARSSGAKYVALDVGPLGQIVGSGGISFDDAYDAFAALIFIAKQFDFDCVIIETMTSLAELRAAVLAVKEHSDFEVACSMSFDRNGRTFFGTDAAAFAVAASALKVDAIGANCSVGPDEMYAVAQKLIEYSPLPVFIKPNAGMPKPGSDGSTVYDLTADEFASSMQKIAALGVNAIGGCCGTTPEFIRKTVLRLGGRDLRARKPYAARRIVSSYANAYEITADTVVGERINPTGKPRFKQALLNGDIDYVLRVGVEQQREGADILDVNVGVNGIDEPQTMLKVIDALSEIIPLPLQIDSSNPEAIETALRHYHGKAIVNSVCGKESSMDRLLPIAAKYGAAIIALTLDENIPSSTAERLEIAQRIIARAEALNIPKTDIYVDALTMAESATRGNAVMVLTALKQCAALGVGTALGVSNVSFGMPGRDDINAAFLQMARESGLLLAIVNPARSALKGSDAAKDFLLAKDGAADAYIAANAACAPLKPEPGVQIDLQTAVTIGSDSAAQIALEMLQSGLTVEQIANDHIIAALDEVGKLYQDGKLFLPQLIAAADAAKAAFSVLMENTPTNSMALTHHTFVIATVKGDIHDIGKNIVASLVRNYGYNVVDLGKDVDTQTVLEALRKHAPCALGLSALMTTTAQNMAATAAAVRAEFPSLPILVGGAVLTEEFAAQMGALYCRDANDTIQKLRFIFKTI